MLVDFRTHLASRDTFYVFSAVLAGNMQGRFKAVGKPGGRNA